MVVINIPDASPYPVSGTIFNLDNSTAVSGATVRIRNERTKEFNPVTTSNSSGFYILGCENFTSQYVDGDTITLEATSGNKVVLYSFTIDVIKGVEEKNLSLDYTDPLGLLDDILTDNWRNSSTDSIEPTFSKVFEEKYLDMANKDYVLFYEVNETVSVFSMGGTRFAHSGLISIDIRTTFKTAAIANVRAHLDKMKREAFRIIKANILNPGGAGGDYRRLWIVRKRDMTDKSTGMGRYIIDVQLDKWIS